LAHDEARDALHPNTHSPRKAEGTERPLYLRLKEFRANPWRSSGQLLLTAACFCGLWLGMWLSLGAGYWLTLLLALPAGGFLVRLFAIQHDCGHGSLFQSRWINDLIGRSLGVLTLTPYDYWRRAHASHHATSGNLDRRGIGDITTLTVLEYNALSARGKFAYRLYRHPLVLFGIGPVYLFVLKHRLPLDLPLLQKGPWLSVLGTNLAIACLLTIMVLLVGPIDFLKIQLPLVLLGSSAGVWLFFVQHQYEAAYWRRGKDWDFRQAALFGSSHYSLPRFLQWMTASIGLHHVHHLSSRIPNYRLQECLERTPELKVAPKLTLIQSVKCATLALWDEQAGRMIRFRDLKKARPIPAA
jgi:omega-6 fatty acid desaturase (delta-12 desaturase)